MLATSALAVGVPVASGAGPQAACQEYSVCGGPTGAGAPGSATGSRRSAPNTAHATGWIRLPLAGYPLTPAILALLAALASGVALGGAIAARARAGRGSPPTA